MAQIIRQSTSIDIAIGPFLDEDTGKDPETTLTITQPDIRLSKNGGAFAQKSASQTLSHMENGWYSCNLSTTDTNTVGRLTLAVHESGALPVFMEFQVVEEAIYDALFTSSATGLLPANVTQIEGGDATDAIAAGAAAALNSYDPPTYAELVFEINSVQSDIAGLNDPSASDVAAAVRAALLGTLESDTAQGDGSGTDTIQLASGASSSNDAYNGYLIAIVAGAGKGQQRYISDYVGSTRTATVVGDWETAVDNTSVYVLFAN